MPKLDQYSQCFTLQFSTYFILYRMILWKEGERLLFLPSWFREKVEDLFREHSVNKTQLQCFWDSDCWIAGLKTLTDSDVLRMKRTLLMKWWRSSSLEGPQHLIQPEKVLWLTEKEFLQNLDLPRACALLMGLIYAVNLSYPKLLKSTFEVFEKTFLELNGLKTSPWVMSLRNKLLH